MSAERNEGSIKSDSQAMGKNRKLVFKKEKVVESEGVAEGDWKMLVVDDEREVHKVTQLVLSGYRSPDNRGLQLLEAYSGKEAIQQIEKHPDLAVILLDVVMETNDAGLGVIRYIREELNNQWVRIILRTGQPGMAPEKDVILRYDINDYKDKTELTTQKLFSAVTTALRSYRDLMTIESFRRNLEQKVHEKTRVLRRKNEELDLALQRLVELDREKSEFMGIAAHDLRNPLNNILMIANMVSDPDFEMTRDEINDYMNQITETVKRMSGIINNFLDVNTIEAGKLDLIRHPFNLLEVARGVMAAYVERAKTKNIDLFFETDAREAMINADEQAVFQILENLLSNAIKFSEKNTSVTIGCICGDASVCLEIKDQGPGISLMDQDKLFTKFAKLAARPTAGEPSTGLGLSIVKKLVEAMDGSVWCESEPDRGATFCVAFPLCKKPAEE